MKQATICMSTVYVSMLELEASIKSKVIMCAAINTLREQVVLQGADASRASTIIRFRNTPYLCVEMRAPKEE